MTVTATTPTTPVAAPDKTALGRTSLAQNFDTFLALLTTQLKNQDPLSPLDSNQFTQQLVQMTGVEQQLNTNDLLKKLVSNTATGVATAVSMIGKNVKAVSDDANITGGKAQWIINVPAEATDAKVQIVDKTGAVLHVESLGDLKAGDHAYAWNGKDQTGKQIADGGPYTLKVSATDASGASVGPINYVQGLVTGVEQSNGATYLTINGGRVTGDKVTSIQEVPKPTSTATNSTTPNSTTNTPASS
jgi:flagellar basal-body rod modification protein FlgD